MAYLMLSLALVSAVLATQTPLQNLNGFDVAMQSLGTSLVEPVIAEAWNDLFESSPERFEQLLSAKAKDPVQISAHADFDEIKHPKFPDHALRVKDPSSLGVDTVKQRSGYIDLLKDDKHFFFWMFESRNDPSTDPIVLWINGGPGCSSSTGLFFELGPAKINKDLSLTSNPHSWTNNATIIFLDQPVNVGFSYSKERVATSTLGAEDVYAFLSLFFEEFPEYSQLPFHISGESYAGHYLPAIGAEILDHDDRNFNFTSVLIGNGITDLTDQADAQVSMACGMGGVKAVLNQTQCQDLYEALPYCLKLSELCDHLESPLSCVIANEVCSTLKTPYYETGRNSYDMRDVCYDDCYPEEKLTALYLNQTHVKEALGAEPVDYEGCSGSVFEDYIMAGDRGLSRKKDVIKLLEAGIPVLLYLGDKDYNCNWLGNQQWSNKLEWTHHEEFEAAPMHPWYFDGDIVGETKNAEHFTFLRIYDAGHMVPMNKPKESLSMFNQWLSGKYSFAK